MLEGRRKRRKEDRSDAPSTREQSRGSDKLSGSSKTETTVQISSKTARSGSLPTKVDTLVIGLVALDTISVLESATVLHDSNPGKTRSSIGGVGYNVALAHSLGLESQKRKDGVRFVSAVGDDAAGQSIIEQLPIDSSGIKRIADVRLAAYNAVIDKRGELVVACADMSIFESDDLATHWENQIRMSLPKQIVVDCNLLQSSLDAVVKAALENSFPPKVIVDPTSAPKLRRLSGISSSRLKVYPANIITMVTPTGAELAEIYLAFTSRELFDDYDEWFPVLDSLNINMNFREKLAALAKTHPAFDQMITKGILQQSFQLLPYVPNILVKLGELGVVLVRLTETASAYKSVPTTLQFAPTVTIVSEGKVFDEQRQFGAVIQYFAVPDKLLAVKNVTGAGDSLLGYLSSTSADWLTQELTSLEQEWGMWHAIHNSQVASAMSLQSEDAISPKIASIPW